MRQKESAERFLLDTHLLLEASFVPEMLSRKARKTLDQDPSAFVFSVVSLWEVVIKRALGRQTFRYDPQRLRSYLLSQGMAELEITAAHTLAVATLRPIHGDPFDRLLIAQASVERLSFVTGDTILAKYPGPILLV